MDNFASDLFAMTNDAEVDMTNVENALLSLKSSFSSGTAPANAEEGQLWYDISKSLLRHRGAVSQWRGVIAFDDETTYADRTKIWVYAAAAEEGFDEDTLVADCVIGVRGGTQAYNVGSAAGDGVEVGSWDQPTYQLLDADIPKHTHPVASGGPHEHELYHDIAGSGSSGLISGICDNVDWGVEFTKSDGAHTHTAGEQATGDGSHRHGGSPGTWRPLAAVGIMIFPELIT